MNVLDNFSLLIVSRWDSHEELHFMQMLHPSPPPHFLLFLFVCGLEMGHRRPGEGPYCDSLLWDWAKQNFRPSKPRVLNEV
jgi:hypothetical protein